MSNLQKLKKDKQQTPVPETENTPLKSETTSPHQVYKNKFSLKNKNKARTTHG